MTLWETGIDAATHPTRWVLAFACAVLLSLFALTARAEPTADERAMAEALFREAKALMGKNEIPAACRKLEESQRLDPRDGTLLNLAVCHEKEGRTASAWVEFQEALAAARSAKRWDRINLAQRHLKALEGKVPHLTVEVSPTANAEGFSLRRDGVELAPPTWGSAVPIDPGEHALEASAPNMKTWSATIQIAESDDKTIVVPALEALPPPPEPDPKPTPKPKPKPPPETSSRTTVAYVVGGAGVLALGVGGYFGFRAMAKSNESDDHCRGSLCDQTGLDLNDDARGAATISNIAVGLGLVGVGVGTYLLLTDEGFPTSASSEASAKRSRNVLVTPVAGRSEAAMVVRGTW